MDTDTRRRIEELESLVKNIARPGRVTNIYPAKGTVRVEFAESYGLLSYELPVLVGKTQDDKHYHMPDIGEHVLCVFLPSGLEQGFVIGSFYSSVDTPPAATENKHHIRFSDGTWLEYDRASHHLRADVVGDVTIRNDGNTLVDSGGDITMKSPSLVTIDAPETVTTGKLRVEGLLEYMAGMMGSGVAATGALGPVSAKITGYLEATEINNEEGLVFSQHRHGGVMSGGDESGGPV
ncbi:phage baseplate assembly protein V [Limisalsivibrio acetivorans]|uniref:phage baseplate assembly protein V n=1 Tax=Limisalsivibrio acetivorans TaxID=1304888 RepID=UPI0003B55D01|nr:phage baseplate assembly protein V [Limisalsivibrio acetivorans]